MKNLMFVLMLVVGFFFVGCGEEEVTISVPKEQKEKAERVATINQIHNLKMGIELYRTMNDDKYPTTLAQMVKSEKLDKDLLTSKLSKEKFYYFNLSEKELREAKKPFLFIYDKESQIAGYVGGEQKYVEDEDVFEAQIEASEKFLGRKAKQE